MQNVKSTMIDRLLDMVAPHYCCSCGDAGSLLCASCKQDIIEEEVYGCLLCGRLAGLTGVCIGCSGVLVRGWYAGERIGALEELINRFKFEHAQAAYRPLGDLLLARLPVLPPETVIVPIPTVRSHVRQRGYDHTLLIARYVAKKQGLSISRCLERLGTDTQRGANKDQRRKQANAAYSVGVDLYADTPYLLVDDIVTTGATLSAASQSLRRAGATIIWAAAVARQPFENSGQ